MTHTNHRILCVIVIRCLVSGYEKERRKIKMMTNKNVSNNNSIGGVDLEPMSLPHVENQLDPVIYQILRLYAEFDGDNFRKDFKEGNLISMFCEIKRPNLIQAYKDVFQYIPDAMKYEAFLHIYTGSERHFNQLTVKILDSVKKLRPESVTAELTKHADDSGFITIYRGECTRSTQVNKALSWSTDEERAKWFATRFIFDSSVGYVYKAKVNIKDVIGFTQARKESEVIVRYKYVELISKEEVNKLPEVS